MGGDVHAFENNWKNRKEANYIHWTEGEPENQIQFAFRQHFLTFEALYNKYARCQKDGARKVIELGAGRGSLSAYYSQTGDDVTVSDFSQAALDLARKIFLRHNLEASFNFVDCEETCYESETFDICASIGLLEHFRDPRRAIEEQFRILKMGALCYAYIVPEKQSKINDEYDWLNMLVQHYEDNKSSLDKETVFRTDYGIDYYTTLFADIGFDVVCSSGIYSVPMISASPQFPFTLLSQEAEHVLVQHFHSLLGSRETELPWLCEEAFGNAILIVGRK